MALVEEYFELHEAEEISAVWKIIQIAFYISAACLGLWCGYTIALLRLKFDDKCYLFTSIKMSSLDGKINNANINWESDSYCDYCQYSMVSSFIVATIWATLFLMCGKGGKSLTGLPQPWRIVWPSLIFNFIYFVVSLYTAINIQQGTDFFCLSKTSDKPTKNLIERCPPLKMVPVKSLYITSLQLEIATKTSWGCAASWLTLFLISFARIIFVIDFNMYRISIFKFGEVLQNKKEEVLRITNYEEPKKIRFDNGNNKPLHAEERGFEAKFEERARKAKINKKSMPIQSNAAFYVMTDIRLLNREKHRKKSFKLLDSTYNKIYLDGVMQSARQGRVAEANISQMPSASHQHNLLNQSETLRERFHDNLSEMQNIEFMRNFNHILNNDNEGSSKFKKSN